MTMEERLQIHREMEERNRENLKKWKEERK